MSAYTRGPVFVPLPKVERATPLVLGGDPKGKTFVYTQDKSVIVRDIENPLIGYTYNEHSVATTVAKYSPSGNYIASADVSGKLRIWDTINQEHILKYEYRPLSGAIKDLAWSADNTRLVVGGEGKETFGAAIMWDTGSTVGEIGGHSKPINSVDFRQDRPFRIITGSEDMESNFYAGPPFKRSANQKDHTRFCQAVRFAPNGSVYVTAGADGKLFLYDGKEGKKIAEINGGAANAHEGGIYAVSWNADNKQFITASADKTVKVWDVEANKAVTTFTFGDDIESQQLGCLWQGANMLSVSLSGFINYLDPSNPSKPRRVLQGHKKLYTGFSVDPASNHAYEASYDGRVSSLDLSTGEFSSYAVSSANAVNSAVFANGTLITTGNDDTVRFTPVGGNSLGEAVKLDAAPVDAAASGETAVVACVNQITVLQGGKKASSLPVKWEPASVAVNPAGTEVVVGSKDSKIHVFKLAAGALTLAKTLDATGSVDVAAFSPDGSHLAIGDSNRNIFVYNAAADYAQVQDNWRFHTAKVLSLAWTPSGRHLASGSLDTNIIVWSLDKPQERVTIKGAHPMAPVSKLAWVADGKLVSAGGDTAIRSWDVKLQ